MVMDNGTAFRRSHGSDRSFFYHQKEGSGIMELSLSRQIMRTKEILRSSVEREGNGCYFDLIKTEHLLVYHWAEVFAFLIPIRLRHCIRVFFEPENAPQLTF